MAYLYSIYSYRMKEEPGEIHIPVNWSRDALFYPNDHSVPKTRYVTSQKEGVVYNRNVWFEKKNRRNAVKLLIQAEQEKIDSLNEQIEKHKACIKRLNEVN